MRYVTSFVRLTSPVKLRHRVTCTRSHGQFQHKVVIHDILWPQGCYSEGGRGAISVITREQRHGEMRRMNTAA